MYGCGSGRKQYQYHVAFELNCALGLLEAICLNGSTYYHCYMEYGYCFSSQLAAKLISPSLKLLHWNIASWLIIQPPPMCRTFTGNFDRIYKGSLSTDDGKSIEVTVKGIIHRSEAEKKKFQNETVLLSRIMHPNIVRLYGIVAGGK